MNICRVVKMTRAYKEVLDSPEAKLSTYMGEYDSEIVPLSEWWYIKYFIPFIIFVLFLGTCIVAMMFGIYIIDISDVDVFRRVFYAEVLCAIVPFLMFLYTKRKRQAEYDRVRVPLLKAGQEQVDHFIAAKVEVYKIDLDYIRRMSEIVEAEVDSKEDWLNQVRTLLPN